MDERIVQVLLFSMRKKMNPFSHLGYVGCRSRAGESIIIIIIIIMIIIKGTLLL